MLCAKNLNRRFRSFESRNRLRAACNKSSDESYSEKDCEVGDNGHSSVEVRMRTQVWCVGKKKEIDSISKCKVSDEGDDVIESGLMMLLHREACTTSIGDDEVESKIVTFQDVTFEICFCAKTRIVAQSSR